MNKYFSISDKVYDVTEQYPELIDLFAANGFENLKNETMRKTVGKSISVEAALKSKRIDLQIFEQKMVDVIEQNNPELSTGLADTRKENPGGELKIAGVLPCPIRVQLLEKLDNWLSNQDTKVSYQLQAASMGLDWIRDQMTGDEDALADVYLSAGFSLFFDRSVMGHHLENGVFSDLTGAEHFNSCFDNESIDLKDPKGQYTIIGVVPAVFMVNTELLGDRPFPESWADLLKPEFEDTVALPMQDLDLFNAVLLSIYNEYGNDGLRKLGRSLLLSMHPAQMVKSGAKKQQSNAPVITVMPYFFTRMTRENSPMRPVWPKDGAIISPIFLITKTASKEKSQPLVDFLFSKEMGGILSASGKFPSTHPEVDNGLSPDQTFMWPGWDFINNNDIGQLLKETEAVFFDTAGGKA
ncbi:ABC transporter substrate-binding protein [Sedimentibacter sp.]|uniref:ABC transporter substrate-binding protein n=1 Tax=Sedimentibacter sp. TaxID=1960295 RepID=UPI0028988F60|nr:ABC transporter substrate-binding protein [Sedimentibacter sp.]